MASLRFCCVVWLLLVGGTAAAQMPLPPPYAPRMPRVLLGSEFLLLNHKGTVPDACSRQPGELLLDVAALKQQRIAVVANHTSRVFGGTHLVDSLRALGFAIQKVFAPEHGFRGELAAGDTVRDGTDTRTGLPIVSLFGSRLKPKPEDLRNVDVVLFDIQDVGCRFYTYLTTLALVMEACAEQGKALWVLDRPNPNGWYADGPVLDTTLRSFVGLHPIPIVHGLTLGEYAHLLNGEGWLAGRAVCKLGIVPAPGYRHSLLWEQTGRPWLPPSPNLRTPAAARYYPILCWYEGTRVSVGRGSATPFEVVGLPGLHRRVQAENDFGAIRVEAPSAAPLLEPSGITPTELGPMRILPTSFNVTHALATPPFYGGSLLPGYRLRGLEADGTRLFRSGLVLLQSLLRVHRLQPVDSAAQPGGLSFFNPYFERLAGTPALRTQIEQGESPERIYLSWLPALQAYRHTRARYLLYAD